RGLRWDVLDSRARRPLPARMLRPAPGTVAAPAARGASARGRRFPGIHVARKGLLAAQLDLSFPVDPDHLDQDRISFVDDVLDALDPVGLELRDVDQAVFTRRDLDEGAERHHPANGSGVDASDLGIFGDPTNDLPRAIPVRPAEGGDANFAGVLDVDLGAGLGADLLDHLAAG